jgi:hypothetical protein
VVVGKTSADGYVLLVPAIGSVHEDFRSVEGVLEVELQKPKIKAIRKIVFQIIETKVKVEITLSLDKCILQRILIQTNLFLVEPRVS